MITIKLRTETRGHHVHCDVFVGSTGTLAKAGSLVFEAAEYQAFAEMLGRGASSDENEANDLLHTEER